MMHVNRTSLIPMATDILFVVSSRITLNAVRNQLNDHLNKFPTCSTDGAYISPSLTAFCAKHVDRSNKNFELISDLQGL